VTQQVLRPTDVEITEISITAFVATMPIDHPEQTQLTVQWASGYRDEGGAFVEMSKASHVFDAAVVAAQADLYAAIKVALYQLLQGAELLPEGEIT